jgi:N-acyl-D-amino-acid deacylase
VLRRKQALFDEMVDDVSLELARHLTQDELFALFGLDVPRPRAGAYPPPHSRTGSSTRRARAARAAGSTPLRSRWRPRRADPTFPSSAFRKHPLLTVMRNPRSLLLVMLALHSAACAPRYVPETRMPTAETYDLLIRNGRILDGTGSPWFLGDVAVRGDRIAAVGRLAGATARDTIDASGLVVAPGFIDMLGHSEYRILLHPGADSKITQGITTEITGEVTSVVPVNENTRRELPAEHRRVADWQDLDGYFRTLERTGTAINLGTFVTLGSVRRYVMGDERRAPEPAELERMKQLVARAMEQGAMGFSTGLIYAPASYASTDEIVELARVSARYGGGYTSHIRSEGNQLLEAVREAIRIGEQAGTWVQIHHLKASGQANWGRVNDAIREIEAARVRGLDVTANMYPYRASGTGLSAIIPNWAHEGGREALVGRLRDPDTRQRIRQELLDPGSGDWRIGASAGGPAGVMIASVSADSLRRYQGMRLSEVAGTRGQDVADALLDLLVADEARTSAVYFSMSEDDVETVLRQPWVSIGVDGGVRPADPALSDRPHPRAFGTFPRILGHYVRERGVLTLEEAVRRFTSLAAARMGLDDRGVLKAGLVADITVFDPATVSDHATFEEPVQTSVGIRHVLVNGVPVLRDGQPTGARPGRALRLRQTN